MIFFFNKNNKGFQLDSWKPPLIVPLIRIFPEGLCQLRRMSSLAHTCLQADGTQAACQALSFGSMFKLLNY